MSGVKGRSGRKKKIQPVIPGGVTPLEYMLAVVRDPEANTLRRDRMAVAAAPYVHAKISERPIGQKVEQAAAAKTAGQGTEWGDDLISPVVRLDQHRAA